MIQRKYALFSDGFLAVHRLSGPLEILAFVFVSLSADAAVLGLFTSLLLFISYKRDFRPRLIRYLILAISLSPLVVTDFVVYRIASYLGDTFDLSLALDMLGGNPMELLAVGFDQIMFPLFLFSGLAGLTAFFTWRFKRPSGNVRQQATAPPPGRGVLMEALCLFAAGFVLLSFARVSDESFDHGLNKKPSGDFLGYLAETFSDVDGDGFGLLRRPLDPAPFDGHRFPYALEIPGNGIDEDGVAGDLPLDQADYHERLAQKPQWRYKPHIVFIMLESFRPDAIGARYDGRPVTPVLEDLAKQGIFSQRAFSHNGYTVQSRYHSFTGNLITHFEQTSLVDDFKAKGYEVAFFSGQDESFGGEEMQVGFERADTAYDARVEVHRRFSEFSTPASLGLPYQVLLERLKAFLSARDSDQPLFLYLNLYDTHFPYYHDDILPLLNDIVVSKFEIQSDRKTALKAMYLNTIANMDRAIGMVLDDLRESLGEMPGVIVVSDHGESLFEDDFLGHGYMINEAQTRIPLIVTGLPMVIEEPFGQSELRGAIHSALAGGSDEGTKPLIKENQKKQVFQYIGNPDQPARIGMRGLNERLTYDFRTHLVQITDLSQTTGLPQTTGRTQIKEKGWRHPKALDTLEYARFQKLIYFWESGRLAKHKGRSD